MTAFLPEPFLADRVIGTAALSDNLRLLITDIIIFYQY